ncbi:MAG: hypothetical protein KBT12_02675 [Bacteroidales bacterium]|nr:hypothetical protein [Candidatus Physcousia equi]
MKKNIIIACIALIIAALVGLVVWLMVEHKKDAEDKQELAQLKELAEMEKAEMENEYQNFANQYQEMKMQINNDSLVAQLEAEQARTQAALEELKRTKASDAKEIMRLKEELKTLREILRQYVQEIDSLQRLNTALNNENQNLRTTNEQQQAHISNLTGERQALSEKVAIAAQLDATGIHAQGNNKKGKATEKIKDVKKLVVSFSISRNVTAQAGNRSIYVRITTPLGDVLTHGGTFHYENRTLEYSIRKDIEYTGEETSITVYWDVAETLSDGTYRADIFADGKNIGHTTFSFR